MTTYKLAREPELRWWQRAGEEKAVSAEIPACVKAWIGLYTNVLAKCTADYSKTSLVAKLSTADCTLNALFALLNALGNGAVPTTAWGSWFESKDVWRWVYKYIKCLFGADGVWAWRGGELVWTAPRTGSKALFGFRWDAAPSLLAAAEKVAGGKGSGRLFVGPVSLLRHSRRGCPLWVDHGDVGPGTAGALLVYIRDTPQKQKEGTRAYGDFTTVLGAVPTAQKDVTMTDAPPLRGAEASNAGMVEAKSVATSDFAILGPLRGPASLGGLGPPRIATAQLHAIGALVHQLLYRNLPNPDPYALYIPATPEIAAILRDRFLTAATLDVAVVKGNKAPAKGGTWAAVVAEIRAAWQARRPRQAFGAEAHLAVRQIPPDDPRPALRGARGVYAAADIAPGLITVYSGYLGQNLRDHVGLLQRLDFDRYAVTTTTRDPGGSEYVVSTCGDRYLTTAALINDYRVTFDKKDDPSRANVRWGELVVNLVVPVITIYAPKKIPKGAELLIDYGDTYFQTLQERHADHAYHAKIADALATHIEVPPARSAKN
ncbi:MAG: hypothetical protein KGL39_21080 [Patescibacteria group bacterium]|nr:hypothetical protein [Patescibacteria group bacterium]